MTVRQRRWVAGLVILGALFAQIVTLAHACTLVVPAPQAAFIEPADAAMPSDCPATAKRIGKNANVCASHCAYGQQIDVQNDAPVAAVGPQPALTVRIVASIVEPALAAISLQARSTAPPVSLLYSRLLI